MGTLLRIYIEIFFNTMEKTSFATKIKDFLSSNQMFKNRTSFIQKQVKQTEIFISQLDSIMNKQPKPKQQKKNTNQPKYEKQYKNDNYLQAQWPPKSIQTNKKNQTVYEEIKKQKQNDHNNSKGENVLNDKICIEEGEQFEKESNAVNFDVENESREIKQKKINQKVDNNSIVSKQNVSEINSHLITFDLILPEIKSYFCGLSKTKIQNVINQQEQNQKTNQKIKMHQILYSSSNLKFTKLLNSNKIKIDEYLQQCINKLLLTNFFDLLVLLAKLSHNKFAQNVADHYLDYQFLKTQLKEQSQLINKEQSHSQINKSNNEKSKEICFKVKSIQGEFMNEQKLWQNSKRQFWLTWIYCLAKGIMQLQKYNIFNMDIKLQNTIYLQKQNIFKIIDFDIAFVVERGESQLSNHLYQNTNNFLILLKIIDSNKLKILCQNMKIFKQQQSLNQFINCKKQQLCYLFKKQMYKYYKNIIPQILNNWNDHINIEGKNVPLSQKEIKQMNDSIEQDQDKHEKCCYSKFIQKIEQLLKLNNKEQKRNNDE